MTAPEAESLRARAQAPRPSVWRGQGPVVAVVALGGGIGAVARYAASLWWPAQSGGFPWTTFGINVVGWAAHRLVRPFFGTGVLGGFTTFSTYAVDIQKLVDAGHPRTALAYLAATLIAALAAVWLAVTAARRVLKWRQR
jgi:CrcB protein